MSDWSDTPYRRSAVRADEDEYTYGYHRPEGFDSLVPDATDQAGDAATGATAEEAPPTVTVEIDRVWPHLVWEAVLALAVAGVAFALLWQDGRLVTGEPLEQLALRAAALGLVAAGLACSLRAAVPNLAVGAVAGFAATVLVLMRDDGWSLSASAFMAVAAAAAVGLGLALVVVGLHVPAWAATLGAAVLLVALTARLRGPDRADALREPIPAVTDWPWPWFGGFAAVSLLGAVAMLFGGFRWWFGGGRTVGEPGRRAGVGAGFAASVALVVSSVLAGLGGLVLLGIRNSADDGQDSAVDLTSAVLDPTLPDLTTVAALAAVLVGGTSLFGRRGGVFGTVLGTLLVTLGLVLLERETDDLGMFALGGLVVAGLVVNRVLERTGRRTETVTAAGWTVRESGELSR